MTCSHCGKRGHDPEQLLWKAVSSLGYDYDVVEDTSLDICAVEAGKWVAPSRSPCATEGWSVCADRGGLVGVIMQNRFHELCTEQESAGEDEETCTGDYFDIGGLDILMPDKVINGVGRTGMLVSAGRGKLPLDFGLRNLS